MAASGVDIVQFSAPIYFVEETEENLTIDLIRLGSLSGRSSVRYATQEGSAKAGVKYHHTSGMVTFEDGEYLKSFHVRIVQDEIWSPTLEFKISLTEPKNAELPFDGGTARVKIIDDDMFPSNKYTDLLVQGEAGIEKISQWGLFVEYLKLNLEHEGMMWRTVLCVIFDQMNNVYLFFLLKARTYLVNVVFNQDEPETRQALILPAHAENDLDDRVMAATLVGVMYLVPMLFLHIWDYCKVIMDVEGHSRVFLQTCIFRKYLNYNEESRQKVRVSHMQVAITNNTADLARAYKDVLEIVQMLGKLCLLMIFMLSQDPEQAWVLVVMPSLMMVFGCCRSTALSEASEYAGPLKKVLIDLTTETCAKYRLIADYAQRPQMNETFERRATELRKSLVPELQVELNNNYFPQWLGPLFIGGYISIMARPLLEGKVTLGVFLATLSVFSEVSGDFANLYEHLMSVNTRLDSLKTLTKYFNMETDVRLLKSMSQHRRDVTKAAWKIALKEPRPPAETGLLRSDLIPIKLDNVSFGYSSIPTSPSSGAVLHDVNLAVQQGKMIAIVGCPGCGKASFMRLLAHTAFPSKGHVLLPMHLRVLFVSQLPTLFDRSPMYNLKFGRPNLEDPELIRSILQELQMDQTLALLEPELQAMASTASGPSPRPNASRGDSRSAKIPNGEGHYIEMKEVEDYDNELSEDEDDEERRGLLKGCCAAAHEEDEVRLDDDFTWQDKLSFTEQVKMCLARALIMNPEVMVLHRPLHNYDSAAQEAVLEVLKRHTRNRGLCLPAETWGSRRPRTVFYTPESVEQAKAADVIWQIDASTSSVTEISAMEIQRDFRTTKEASWARQLRVNWSSQHVEDHARMMDKNIG